MNIHNKLVLAAVALIASASVSATNVHAQTAVSATGGARLGAEINVDTKTKLGDTIDAETSVSASTTVETRTQNTSNTRGSDDRDDMEDRDTETAAEGDMRKASTTKDQGATLSAEHRSTVATFVRSLLSVADREGGIGAEVRTVAQSQDDAASTTATAIVKVEERGSLRTFFFGSDYKNLGVIRSAIATTTANITKLKMLLEKAESGTGSAELTLQVNALEAEQAKVSAYVTAHEDTFSLFGWAAKLFIK